MRKGKRHVRSFEARDSSGRSHTLDQYVEILDVGDFENPNDESEGLMEIVTSDGGHVNRLDKGRYQVVQTNEILQSDDPQAP